MIYTIEVTVCPTPKSAYRQRWAFDSEGQAALYWNGLNIGNGYRARIRCNGHTVARKVS